MVKGLEVMITLTMWPVMTVAYFGVISNADLPYIDVASALVVLS